MAEINSSNISVGTTVPSVGITKSTFAAAAAADDDYYYYIALKFMA